MRVSVWVLLRCWKNNSYTVVNWHMLMSVILLMTCVLFLSYFDSLFCYKKEAKKSYSFLIFIHDLWHIISLTMDGLITLFSIFLFLVYLFIGLSLYIKDLQMIWNKSVIRILAQYKWNPAENRNPIFLDSTLFL